MTACRYDIARFVRLLATLQARFLLQRLHSMPHAPVVESKDRRRHARVDCVAPVHIVAEHRTFLGVADELSTGGMRVRCASSLVAGERVGVRLHMNGSPGVLVEAEVVWVEPQRLALRFVRLGAAALRVLCRLTARA